MTQRWIAWFTAITSGEFSPKLDVILAGYIQHEMQHIYMAHYGTRYPSCQFTWQSLENLNRQLPQRSPVYKNEAAQPPPLCSKLGNKWQPRATHKNATINHHQPTNINHPSSPKRRLQWLWLSAQLRLCDTFVCRVGKDQKPQALLDPGNHLGGHRRWRQLPWTYLMNVRVVCSSMMVVTGSDYLIVLA